MKKFLSNKQNIFLLTSIIFITSLFVIYGYRLVHFYKLEHPKTVDNKVLLSDKIKTYEDITGSGNGLYKDKDTYYFKGNPTDNYLLFSGKMFRIVSIDEEANIKLITEETQTLLNYNNVYKWMNESDLNTGLFSKTIDTSFLVNTSICTNRIDEVSKVLCEASTNDNLIDLISLDEYVKAGANNSYLNNNSYFWTSTLNSDNDVWYVFDKGGINVASISDGHNYGIRPVITLNGNTELISGIGTVDDPFIVEKTDKNFLNDSYVGEYVSFSNMTFRIIAKSDNKVKVALDGYIKEDDNDKLYSFDKDENVFSLKTDIGSYLNNEFYDSLENKDYVVSTVFSIGEYINDYMSIFNEQIETNVGLVQVGDFYINEYSNIFTLNRNQDNIYTISSDNKLFINNVNSSLNIRPVISLDGTLLISGLGTKESPYIVSR